MAFQVQALKGYNSSSYWQYVYQMEKVPLVLEHLISVLPLTNGPLSIVDYGCSEAFNSMKLFSKVFNEFRLVSDRPIQLLHTDLPDNNWIAAFKVLNSSDSDTAQPKIFYSALGRSFFDQIVPDNSVHFGFSSLAFHYLSKKPIRKEGETGLFHSGYLRQAKEDIERLLNLRLNELVQGGVLTVLIGARTETFDAKMARLIFEPFSNLVAEGLVSQEEIDKIEFTTYSMTQNEFSELFEKINQRGKVLEFKIEKSVDPYYLEFLNDGDLEKYKNGLTGFVMQIVNPLLRENLQRNEEDLQRILQFFTNNINKIIETDQSERYSTFANFVIQKI